MAEEVANEDLDNAPAEEAAADAPQQETVEAQDDVQEETGLKETKTLLSDDGGEGSEDAEPIEYEFTPTEGFDKNRSSTLPKLQESLELAKSNSKNLWSLTLREVKRRWLNRPTLILNVSTHGANRLKPTRRLGAKPLMPTLAISDASPMPMGTKS